MKLKELLKVLDTDEIELYVNGKSIGFVRSGGINSETLSIPSYLESEVKTILPWADYNDDLITDVFVQLPFDEEKWIKDMVNEFLHNHVHKKPNSGVFYATYDNTTFIIDVKNPTHIGYAKCSKKDKFDVNKGIAVAWARYKGYNIPEEL